MLENIQIQPHPARELIKKYQIPLSKIAQFCGCSYHHMSHVLSGTVQPGSKIKPKLDKIYNHLLSKED